MTQETFVKVCGLTNEEQIDWAVDLGYNAIGIVISPRSKRYCSPNAAIELANYSRGRILTFAVALQFAEVAGIASYFDTIQLYEMADIPNLAFSSGTPPAQTDTLQYFFYDASVGSGVFHEIPTWVQSIPGKIVIAGGLNAENARDVIERFNPYGIDVSSSVEIAPGIKSHKKMATFIRAARTPSVNRPGFTRHSVAG